MRETGGQKQATARYSVLEAMLRLLRLFPFSCHNKILQLAHSAVFKFGGLLHLLDINLTKQDNIYHRSKVWSRSARFSDDLQI